MERGRLQKLLLQGEYLELDDIVLAEGQFIELDKVGDGVRQVTLGLTPENFVIAKQNVLNYKQYPEVYYNANSDLDIDGLEVEWAIPVCFVDILPVRNEQRTLKIKSLAGKKNFYVLSSLGDTEQVWAKWMERLDYMKQDPYGYMRSLHKHFNLEYPRVPVPDESIKSERLESREIERKPSLNTELSKKGKKNKARRKHAKTTKKAMTSNLETRNEHVSIKETRKKNVAAKGGKTSKFCGKCCI